MRKIVFALITCALLFAQDARGQRVYEQIGGHYLEDVVREHRNGIYLPVRPIGTRDTLLMWVQGVSRSRGPDYEAARHADVVVWCYPSKYPDTRHPLPNAGVVAVSVRSLRGKEWVTVHDYSELPENVREKVHSIETQ